MAVGWTDGGAVGTGTMVGYLVGTLVGPAVVGLLVGSEVGDGDGSDVGAPLVGCDVGTADGSNVGNCVGVKLGKWKGSAAICLLSHATDSLSTFVGFASA